jgi:uncharacterized protein (DUF1800 family)
MTGSLEAVDPAWAWAPFAPEETTPWTPRQAAHLYRRAGFAADAATLSAAVEQSPQEVVRGLFQASESPEYRAEVDELARATVATGDAKKLPAWWTYRLLTTPTPLHEKAVLFWHGHFATSAAKVEDPELMREQNELLRRHALGDFGAMVQEISRDPAMLLWLDSATNRKAHPNENYAREVMELFCLGEGNYTEQDIRELARCFTGWEIKLKQYRFNRYQADSETKSLFGQPVRTGEEGVDLVLRRDACPRFVVRKLIQFYLFDEPAPSEALIDPLARQLRESNLVVAPVLQTMLASNLCFSRHAIGRKVRSPVELGIGFLRALEGTTNSYDLATGLADLGQHLFYPPNVKGWDGGRTWINSSTLLGRANLIRTLLDHNKTRFAGGTLAQLVDSQGLRRGEQIVTRLEELLLAVPLPSEVRGDLARRIDAGKDRERTLKDAVHLLATQPEFQLA